MGTLEVLHRLEALGVTLWVDSDMVRYRPASKVPADLVPMLKAAKPAIMQHLRYRQKYPGDGPPGDAELQEIEGRVLSQGYCLLWATALADFVAFYHDEADRARIPPGFVPYSMEELGRLFGDRTEVAMSTLRLIHQAKKLGGGSVVSTEGEP